MPARSVRNGSNTVTMRDIAQAAGVSQSTVSRVLNQTGLDITISEETRKRVHASVMALGYQPNLAARSLRGQPSRMIAVMIADISNAFYHFIVRTVQDVARQHHYDVLVANTDQIYENERYFCQAMMRRPVDGIILVPYHLTDDEIGTLMERTGAQVTVLAAHLRHPAIDRVYADDGNATYDVVRWLVQSKSHTRIGYIGVPSSYPPGIRRRDGLIRALTDCGLTLDPDHEQIGDFTVASGQRCIRALLALPNPPSAVFVCNDLMAMGAINAALDLGVRIPEELALVGFDNIPETTLIRPNLTTVAQFPVQIGQHLVTSLFERIEGKVTGPGRTYQVPLQLIERQTT